VRTPFFYGWLIVAVAFVTMAIGVNARTSFSLLFPPILAEFGWPRATTAGAFSVGFLVSAVFSPLVGRLMDRFGPRVVIELGVAAAALGLIAASLTSQPWHLHLTLGALVATGGVCLGYTGQALFLPNWFARRRGLAMSIAYSGVGAGSIVLLPLVQLLIERNGWRWTCVAMGIAVLVVLAPLNLLLRKTPQEMGLLPDGDPAPASGTQAKPGLRVLDAAWVATDWTLGRAASTARFWWIAIGFAAGLLAWYGVQVHQTKYLVEVGFSTDLAAWALGFVSLVAVPGQIALGHLSDRIGREWVWTIGALGFAICYAALLPMQHSPHPVLLWTMVVSQGLLGYGMSSVVAAIVADVFQGRHFGTIMGTLLGFGIVGGALGPWILGLAYDMTGSYAFGFWIALAGCFLSAISIWIAAPRNVRAVT
jgi:MFS family permease